jgi:hypothetical protein
MLLLLLRIGNFINRQGAMFTKSAKFNMFGNRQVTKFAGLPRKVKGSSWQLGLSWPLGGLG